MPKPTSQHPSLPARQRWPGTYTLKGRVVYDRKRHHWSRGDLHRIQVALQEDIGGARSFEDIWGAGARNLLKDFILDFLRWLLARSRSGAPSKIGAIVLALVFEVLQEYFEDNVMDAVIKAMKKTLAEQIKANPVLNAQ